MNSVITVKRPTHSANLHPPTIAFALCVKYLYQNLIDRILSNLIPKFSNHVIRIGRGYFRATDRRGKERLVHRKISSCHKRRNFFKQSLPGSSLHPAVSWALWFWHTRLECQPTQLSKPEPQTGKSIQKKFIEAEAYLSFLLHPKKRFTHLQLNSPTKALFPSNVIVDLWSCKSSFNPEGLAFFNRYVLLVYFTRIPRYMIYLKNISRLNKSSLYSSLNPIRLQDRFLAILVQPVLIFHPLNVILR